MNFESMLKKFSDSGASSGLATGLLGGLAGSLLMTKGGRKFGKNALKVGGVAAVGALAYSAYKNYTNKQNAAPSIDESKFVPSIANDDQPNTDLELLLAKAMIAASRADGQIEIEESQTIINQIRSFELEENQEFQLMHQFNQPTDIEGIIKAANSIEIATEIYAVSLLVIDEANEAEQAYLAMLSDRLQLPGELVEAIENEVGENKHKLAA